MLNNFEGYHRVNTCDMYNMWLTAEDS